MSQLVKLFPNQTLAEVLCLFFMNPHEEFYQANIVRETGKALIQVQRSLKKLEQTGLVVSRKRGRKHYYQAKTLHPAFEDLKKAFIKTIGIGDQLRQNLEKHHKTIDLAWVFGSVARGEEQKDSDIDILFISSMSLEEISKIVGPISTSMRRELNAVFLKPEEFYKKVSLSDYFISDLMKSPKIWLIGSDDELERFVEKHSVNEPAAHS